MHSIIKTFTVASLLLTTPCLADESATRLGFHVAGASSGDTEDPDKGFGVQGELPIGSSGFSIELSASKFKDNFDSPDISIEQNLTSVGVSGIYRIPSDAGMGVYILAGANYNMVDADIGINQTTSPGVRASADIDDAFGVHAGLGLRMTLADNIELFTEYRYTILELEGTIKATDGISTVEEDVEGDYDFGLLKVGLNFLF